MEADTECHETHFWLASARLCPGSPSTWLCCTVCREEEEEEQPGSCLATATTAVGTQPALLRGTMSTVVLVLLQAIGFVAPITKKMGP